MLSKRCFLAVLIAVASWAAVSPRAEAADPTIAAAGNIACDTTSPYFMAGAGTATRCRQAATAKLLSGGLSAVLALGSNQYCCGTLSAYLASYNSSWGAVKSITRSVPGSREYATADAAGYFDYFNGPGASGGPAGQRGLGFYSFDLGSWHLVALNSNCSRVSCATGSAQERWLRADLAAHPTSCTLAYMHAPRFSSGKPGGVLSVKPLWQALYDAGAEAVLSASARDYERFRPLAPSGRFDGAFGLRQFVVGTGGYGLGTVGAPKQNSEVLDNKTFGVLQLTLQPGGYLWAFTGEAGTTFSDTGGSACHGAPPPKAAPPPGGGKKKKGRCTIQGTLRDDVLVGTRGRDVICGLGGNDRISGGGGNDLLDGGRGNDRLRGDAGNDKLRGGPGKDRLLGGRGKDRLYGDKGPDVLRGQSGNDRLKGGGGRDRLSGGAGRDSLVGADDRRIKDRLNGGRGRDRGRIGPRDTARSIERLTRKRR
jgi:hemolysin type calcium-binding protein